MGLTRRLMLLLPASLAAQPATRSGQWAASAGSRRFGGAWTAREHEEPDAGTGAWTLLDPNGSVLASGWWSARKEADGWQGAWAAETENGARLEGSWSARTPLRGSLPFIQMLDSARVKAVTGAWSSRARSGNWTLQAQP